MDTTHADPSHPSDILTPSVPATLPALSASAPPSSPQEIQSDDETSAGWLDFLEYAGYVCLRFMAAAVIMLAFIGLIYVVHGIPPVGARRARIAMVTTDQPPSEPTGLRR